MAETSAGLRIRKTMLEVIDEQSKRSGGSVQATEVLPEVANRVGATRNETIQQAILVYWSDLFRSGQIGWGVNFSNPGPPFFHVTDRGRETLRHLSRDPANPDGYKENLSQTVTVAPIVQSYINKALNCYGSNCYKAAAVMVGAASEWLILDLRDALILRFRFARSRYQRR